MENLKTYDLKTRTFSFSLQIIRFIETLSKDYTCQVLSKQLLRSATSVGANIIEAQSASSRKDFANFYNIALRSANETKYWLALLENSKKAESAPVKILEKESDELSKILAKCLITLRNSIK